ncbi:hypothetical protein BKA83DRAFT_4289096 [Pisolithus microcarpus]|nr:hypothetical protein BKA83DRAFT_4289096 [Pisolithus microcarpus]
MHGTSVQASDRISAGARLQSLAESRMWTTQLRVQSLSVLWYLFFLSLFLPKISALHASGFKKTVQRQVLVLFQAAPYTSDGNSSDEQGFVPSRQTVVPVSVRSSRHSQVSIPRNIIARNPDGAVNAIHSVDMSRQKLSSGGALVMHRKPSSTPSP